MRKHLKFSPCQSLTHWLTLSRPVPSRPVCIQNHLRVFRTITKSCKPYQTRLKLYQIHTKPLPNLYQTHTKPYQTLPNPYPYKTLQTVPNLIKSYLTKHLPNLHQTLLNPTKPLPNLYQTFNKPYKTLTKLYQTLPNPNQILPNLSKSLSPYKLFQTL